MARWQAHKNRFSAIRRECCTVRLRTMIARQLAASIGNINESRAAAPSRSNSRLAKMANRLLFRREWSQITGAWCRRRRPAAVRRRRAHARRSELRGIHTAGFPVSPGHHRPVRQPPVRRAVSGEHVAVRSAHSGREHAHVLRAGARQDRAPARGDLPRAGSIRWPSSWTTSATGT